MNSGNRKSIALGIEDVEFDGLAGVELVEELVALGEVELEEAARACP